MIAYLQGTVLKKTPKALIIKTQELGYFVHVSQNKAAEIQEGQTIEFYIYNHIREDSFDLYGFSVYQELEFFKQLISISGIGPKAGLEICNISTDKIKNAIINEDVSFITTIPGIGKKTAQRMIIELKNKVEIENIENLNPQESKVNNDIVEALINLGYQRKHITDVLHKVPEDIIGEQEIITYFLKNA